MRQAGTAAGGDRQDVRDGPLTRAQAPTESRGWGPSPHPRAGGQFRVCRPEPVNLVSGVRSSTAAPGAEWTPGTELVVLC